MFSRLKRQLQIFAPLSAGLLIIAMITALGGLWNYQNELNGQLSAKPQAVITGLSLASQSQHKPGSSAAAGNVVGNAAGSSPSGGNDNNDSSRQSSAGIIPASTSSPTNETSNDRPAASPASVVSVSLSVNGQAKGSVKLTADSTQCDVLSQALAEGVISELDMPYSSQYGTKVVYVIDGIGKPGTVQWTYTVDGKSPRWGCGYIPAHNGDSVNWQY